MKISGSSRGAATIKLRNPLVVPAASLSTKALLSSAVHLELHGEYHGALWLSNQATRRSPRSSDAWYSKGNYLQCLGQYRSALPCWERVLRIGGHRSMLAGAWHGKGQGMMALGRATEAVECFSRAIALSLKHNPECSAWRAGVREDLRKARDKVAKRK